MYVTAVELSLKSFHEVNKGDNLIFMEELENWDQVATWDGYIGYVEKKSVSDVQTLNMDRAAVGESYTYLTLDEPVNLVWHQVMSSRCQCRTFRFHPEHDRSKCDFPYLVLCDRQQRQYY